MNADQPERAIQQPCRVVDVEEDHRDYDRRGATRPGAAPAQARSGGAARVSRSPPAPVARRATPFFVLPFLSLLHAVYSDNAELTSVSALVSALLTSDLPSRTDCSIVSNADWILSSCGPKVHGT